MTGTPEQRYALSLLYAITHLHDALATGEATEAERKIIREAHDRITLVHNGAQRRVREGQSARDRRKVPKLGTS